MDRIKKTLGIEAGEGALLGALMLLSFFFGAANNFVETAAFTLFLSEFPAQSLPYTYLIVAVVVSGLAFGYLQLGARLPFNRLLIINVSFLAGLALIFQFGLLSPLGRDVKFTLPLLFQIQVNFINLAFWGLLVRIFTVQQAKRLFGLAGSGLWLGIIVTGFLMPIFVGRFGLNNLMWFASGSLVLGLGALLLVLHKYGTGLRARPKKVQNRQSGLRRRGSNRGRFVYLIFGLVVIWWIVFFFVDVLYYDRLSARFDSQEAMAGFIGVYLALLGIFTWVINTFVSAWFFKRFGQQKALLLLPVMLALAAALLFIAANIPGAIASLFFIMVAVKLFNVGIGFSLDRSALTILYQPLPESTRGRTQTLAEGIVQPIAIGLAGIMLIILNTVLRLDLKWMYLVFLGLTGIWVTVALILGREYIHMLFSAIDRRIFGKLHLEIADRDLVDYLNQAIESPFEGTVLYAVSILERIDGADFPALLLKLTQHADEVVSRDALNRIEHRRDDLALERVREMTQHESRPMLKGQAMIVLANLGNEQDKNWLARQLNTNDEALRQSAMAGLLKYCQGDPYRAAWQQLEILAASSRANNRLRAAEMLALSEIADAKTWLLLLLADADSGVQRTAVSAAGKLDSDVEIVDKLLALGRQPGLSSAVGAALTKIGLRSLQLIQDPFERYVREKDLAQAARLARVLGRIPDLENLESLRNALLHPAVRIRSTVIEALGRQSWQPEERAEQHSAAQFLELEINAIAWSQAARADLGGSEPEQVLKQYLFRFRAQSFERMFSGFSFFYAPDVVSVLAAVMARPDITENERAIALEFAEATFSKGHHGLLRALLQEGDSPYFLDQSPQPALDLPSRLIDIYAFFGAAAQPVGQALVLNVVAEQQVQGLLVQLAEAAEDNSMFLQGTARSVAGQLLRTTAWKRTAQLQDPDALIPHLEKQWPVKNEEPKMLSPIEKLLILKSVVLFETTSDDILAELALLLYEVDLAAGETLFQRGDPGDCMYIFVSGEVKVHDDKQVLTELSDHDSFGEIAMLDEMSRVASVTANKDTRLLRLDQEPFYELMDEQIDIVRAIIQQLTRYVRDNVAKVERLHECFPEARAAAK